MKDYIRFKAGPAILDQVREEGLKPERVRVFAGPAGGPKWFVSVGFDRGLMRTGFLGRGGGRVILAGSSAGAWRCIAMASSNPEESYERLRIAYSRNVFTAADNPRTISASLKANVDAFLRPEAYDYILNHPVYDLAVHTARARGAAASENVRIQGLGLLGGAALNAFSSRAMGVFFERVLFYAAAQPPEFLRNSFRGRYVKLTRENLPKAALATGSLPYIIAGVRDIAGAPDGVYRDGGILDYQLNQDYRPGDGGITLFLHYQERIVPGWFDKPWTWRRPSPETVERVFQVYPGPDFVKLLPDGRIPDREDFTTFVDDPAERMRRWDQASELSGILWDEFMEAVESNRIRDRVSPI